MKTWIEFVQGNGGENPTIPVGQNNENPNNMPPVSSKNNSNEDDKVMETLTNDLQRAVERFFQVISKRQLNKQKAMTLLSTIISTISNQYGLNATNVRQASQQGLQTNAEPISPPLQPQAN